MKCPNCQLADEVIKVDNTAFRCNRCSKQVYTFPADPVVHTVQEVNGKIVHAARTRPKVMIKTFTGKRLDVPRLKIDHFHDRDIAHALSQQPMYGGHTHYLYTRAQHCLNLARSVPPEFRLSCLLYMSWSAYVWDVHEHRNIDTLALQTMITNFYVRPPWKVLVHPNDNPVTAGVLAQLQKEEHEMLFNDGPGNDNRDIWPVSTVTAEHQFLRYFNDDMEVSRRHAHP